MTCTVGYVDNSTVIIASDSAALEGTMVTIRKGSSKVWEYKNMVIGFAGSFGLCQWIRYVFEWPKISKKWTVDQVHAYLVKCSGLIEEGLRKRHVNNTDETVYDWQLMIGVGGTAYREASLFVMYSNGDVEQSADYYAAIGSAAMIALGSLYATKNLNITSWEHIETALEAAAANDCCIKKPWNVLYK